MDNFGGPRWLRTWPSVGRQTGAKRCEFSWIKGQQPSTRLGAINVQLNVLRTFFCCQDFYAGFLSPQKQTRSRTKCVDARRVPGWFLQICTKSFFSNLNCTEESENAQICWHLVIQKSWNFLEKMLENTQPKKWNRWKSDQSVHIEVANCAPGFKNHSLRFVAFGSHCSGKMWGPHRFFNRFSFVVGFSSFFFRNCNCLTASGVLWWGIFWPFIASNIWGKAKIVQMGAQKTMRVCRRLRASDYRHRGQSPTSTLCVSSSVYCW